MSRRATLVGPVLAALLINAGSPRSASADRRFRVPDYNEWGVMIDAGVPDGFNGAVTWRPDLQLRLHLGGGHNLIGKGIRGGVTMLALRKWFSPSVTFEFGHYFPGDANRLIQKVADNETIDIAALQSVGYHYGNAHFGFEMGIHRFTFYLHAGGSFVMTTLRGLEETIAEQMPREPEDPMIVIGDDPDVLAFTISARLGMILYF